MRHILNSTLLLGFLMSCVPNDSTLEWWTQEDRQYVLAELNRTTAEIKNEIKDLTQAQWDFKENADRWSIGEIIEHLEMQNQLHYREITTASKAPQYLQFRAITEGEDAHFTNYSTDSVLGTASWFLEPLGRFRTLKEGDYAFNKARGELIKFVEETHVDLRKQFTFRVPVEGRSISSLSIGEVRDLHQLLLTGIAHTDRHLRQIKNLKLHPGYPN